MSAAPPDATREPDPPVDPPVAAPEVPLLTLRDGLPDVTAARSELPALVERFAAGTGPFAIDAERASGYRYSQRAYLIQMRRVGAGSALVDPVGFGDVPNQSLRALSDAVADAEWVIHAASQDLACLAGVGLQPRTLFDTELAGRLLNYPRVGLAVLVEDLLGFRMRKEHSAVDWSKRPLPEPWLIYAALDVEMLVELRDVLAQQLADAGKAQWAAEEFAAWVTMVSYPARKEPWRRTSGIHRVRGRRGLAVVRAMWQLRDELARQRDITSNRIMADTTIVETASAGPLSRNAMGRLPGFATRSGQRYLREFHHAVTVALELADAELPATGAQHDGPPPPRSWADKSPEAAARLGRCREAVSGLAELHDIPQENLLAPDAVRRLAWAPPQETTAQDVAAALRATGAREWQISLTAADLADALTGA